MIIIVTLTLVISTLFGYLFYKKSCRNDIFGRFAEIHSIFENAKNIAYQKIFDSDILVHTSSHVKVNQKDLKLWRAEYLKLVIRACGSAIFSELIEMYGDEDSLSIIILNEFISKIREDEERFIIDHTKEDLIEGEEDAK